MRDRATPSHLDAVPWVALTPAQVASIGFEALLKAVTRRQIIMLWRDRLERYRECNKQGCRKYKAKKEAK